MSETKKIKCKECEHWVTYIPKPPLPGLLRVNIEIKPGREIRKFLTCDNPTTPHTNEYTINT